MNESLGQVSKLAHQLSAATDWVAECEANFKRAKEDKRRIEEEDLPELMRELGLQELKLDDGSKVSVVDELTCSISEERKPEAHAWLCGHGYGGIIKTGVQVLFNRDEHDEAVKAAERIEHDIGRPAVLSESVHPMTLKSFLKERMEAGDDLPYETFGMRPYSKAKLTKPKR